MTDPQYLFRNMSVAASTTLNSTNIIDCSLASKVSIEVKNTGSSTNVTVNINGSLTYDITGYGTLQPVTLGAGGSTEVYITKECIPEKLWAQVVNNDPSNAALITVVVLVKPADVVNVQGESSSIITDESTSGLKVIPKSNTNGYIFDGTNKLTLAGTFASIGLENIVKIRNLTTGHWVYVSDAGQKGEFSSFEQWSLVNGTFTQPISVDSVNGNAVITITKTNTHFSTGDAWLILVNI